MRLRLTKIDEFQFLTCLQHQLWGSKTPRFKNWEVGDYLGFIVDKSIAGLAEVSGEPFLSDEILWDNDLYPYRIPIKFVQAMLPKDRPPVLGKIRDAITSEVGPRYGWVVMTQRPMSGKTANTIIDHIFSRPNDLAEIEANLDHLLAEAKAHRKALAKQQRVPKASQ